MFGWKREYQDLKRKCLQQSADFINLKHERNDLVKRIRDLLLQVEILKGRQHVEDGLFDPGAEGWRELPLDDRATRWYSPDEKWHFTVFHKRAMCSLVNTEALNGPVRTRYAGPLPSKSLINETIRLDVESREEMTDE